ncbi:MAG: hypothetical protein ACKVOM_13070 [Ferruginibacter sp.]
MLKEIINISCKEATMLALKKEENEISGLENFKLQLHFFICNGCKRFASQSKLIGDNAKNSTVYMTTAMDAQRKNDIKKMLV